MTMWFSGIAVPADTTGWTITEAWKPTGSYYYFEAQSKIILDQCRKQPDGYLIFPAIIQSAHKVIVDGQVVARFGDPSFKTVETYYGAPQFKCSNIPHDGALLVWQVYSSAQYFSHFSSMPKVNSSPSFQNFFNETLPIIAAGTLLVLAMFCFAVFYKKIPLPLTLSLVFSCIELSVYFITTNSKYFNLNMDLLTTVKISDSNLWIGICLFIYCLRLGGLLGKRIFMSYAGLIGVSVLIILTAADVDAEQNGTSLPFIFSIIILAIAFYKVTKQLLQKQGPFRLNVLRSLSFGIFFVACLNDSFVVMGFYENNMMLPIGVVAGLMFFALAVNEQITRAYAERDHLRYHLEEEVINKTHDLTLARDHALEATKAKDSFLANMSHEIRTPLTTIIGFAEYSLDRNISNDERSSALRTVVSSGNHLLALINDVLDFSKVEANSIEIEPLNINPVILASEVQSLVMPSANKKDLFVNIEYGFPLPAYVVSDPVRLKQILLNICSNAVKFTEKGGITIKLAFDVERNLMRFRVKDSGIGMSSEQMTKIFDPFKQADSSITRRYGGTGLGLSLSRRLARLLGGSLQVSSESNVGSEFELTIDAGDIQHAPLVHDSEQLVERIASPTESHQEVKLQGKVLLAEDNENNQRLFYLYLSKMGLELTLAENGQEALASASEQDFDLIFMDMQMPVMSGVDAVKHLRQQGYDQPIVALTANATKEDRMQCLEAGCDDFVTKPVTRKRFYQTAAQFLKPAPEEAASNEPLVSTVLEEEPELADIIKKFTDSLPEMIQTISNSYHEKDWQIFNKEVHNLKGMGGGFGYPQITELSENMELSLMKGNHLAIEAILSELEKLRDRITAGAENLKQAG